MASPTAQIKELPELKLRAVSLYKNNLGFFERKVSLCEGRTADSGSKCFALRVPSDRKALVIDTLIAGSNATVKYDAGPRPVPAPDDTFMFALGGGSLGAFLESCVGANVQVGLGWVEGQPASTVQGQILMLERSEVDIYPRV